MKITKAIIPVAGWGTRRLPITKSIEKCMLPIGNRPIVDYVVRDCIAAGITDIYFIVSDTGDQLRAYYSQNENLEAYLKTNKKEDKLPIVEPPKGVQFHYITQPQDGKYGTSIPVALAVPYLKEGESVVVLMGDDFIFNADGSSEVMRLLNATPEGESAMLCAEVDRQEVARYGVVEMNNDDEYIRIVEHPDPSATPSTLINISKYVMNYKLLQYITRHAASEQTGEHYIIDPMNEYVKEGNRMYVYPAVGHYLDGGSVEGWLRANQVVLMEERLL
jgi:UTP--glucose-1-phosphate uridylyltransferase